MYAVSQPLQLVPLLHSLAASVSNQTPTSTPAHTKTHQQSPLTTTRALAILNNLHLKNYAAPASTPTRTGNSTTAAPGTAQTQMGAPMNTMITARNKPTDPDWDAPDAGYDMFVRQCRFEKQVPVSWIEDVVVG
jgi:hypothetical protein